MDDRELKEILATKAPAYERSFIEIPRDSIIPHHSSLSDYMDKLVNYDAKMLSRIDDLVMRYRLGAVHKTMNNHFGSVLPRINKKGMIVGGSVTDPNVFFGEHLCRDRQTVVVQEEKTVLLGALAHPNYDWLAVGVGNNLTDAMMKKFMGRQVILFPDDFCFDFWSEHFGSKFKVDDSFTHQDINQYLIDFIHNRQVP